MRQTSQSRTREAIWGQLSIVIISSRLQISQLAQSLYMNLSLHPDLVPHRPEAHEDDSVKVFELGIAHGQVVEVEVLVSEHSEVDPPRSGLA